MRELTFKGFLNRYVKALSYSETGNISKLTDEALYKNIRLREPLLLYALFSRKQDLLLKSVVDTELYDEYKAMISNYGENDIVTMLESNAEILGEGYYKVWHSFLTQKNKLKTDDRTKELIRKKIVALQREKSVTNYRIYSDLNLNPGNINAWLKHGKSDKVSLQTARNILKYIERQ